MIYVYWIAFTEAVGIAAGFLTREDVKVYASSIVKPFLSPPALLFPAVWTVLYALMGVSAARIYAAPESDERTRGLRLFMFQLGINFAWCFVFFTLRMFLLASLCLAVMLVLVVMMCLCFRRIDPLSAYLQLPYVLWLVFAEYLSLGVYFLNG
ncbi:MAG: tryptophan-rich sensory protein [Synergistaceae bacterium]|nr:tryptophan-rich sensory protein [Synergistaceae bacterium]